MKHSVYHIPEMDCAAEESMVRMKLQPVKGIKKLRFDLEARRLDVFHDADEQQITRLLEELDLGARLVESTSMDDQTFEPDDTQQQRRLLWTVLGINFAFFLLEITTGFLANSMGLVADSLDMLADAIVYGLSLLAVGAAVSRKKRVARLSGYFQMFLALLGLIEVVRRFIGAEPLPDFRMMIGISTLALIANSFALWILTRSKSQEAHMKASMIFTSNDVIINTGVILAGVLVLLTNSKYPDLVMGAIVFVIVMRGALRILKLGRE